MGASDIIEGTLKIIAPPDDAHPEAQYAWRVRVALVACSGLGLALIQGVLSLGVLPAVYPGFAKATDLASMVNEIRQNRLANVDGQLLDLRIKHCEAKSPEAKQLYWTKISQGMEEYQRLTGHPYNLPACSDL
jgi:hypothetical protein